MTSVMFTNWTSEDFTWTWNSVPYTFKKGQPIYLEDYLAKHFAKHLVDRELFRQDKQINDGSRDALLAKCIQDDESSEEVAPEKIAMEVLNKNMNESKKAPFCADCDSKGVKHKKGCPSLTKKEPEEVFEGLK